MVLERALRLESGPWVKTFQDWSRGSTRSGLHPNEPFNFIPPPTGGATSQMFNFGLVVFRATGRKLASLLQANPVWRSWVREFKLFVDPWWFMRNDRLGFRAKQGNHAGLDYCFERSLRPTRRPRLTSSRYVRMAIRFVALRSLDLSRILFFGRFLELELRKLHVTDWIILDASSISQWETHHSNLIIL